MPGVDTAGVSRKIDDSQQRDRLKKIAAEIKPPEGFGLIVRTVGSGPDEARAAAGPALPAAPVAIDPAGLAGGSVPRPGLPRGRPGDPHHPRPPQRRHQRGLGRQPETYDKALEFVKDVMPGRAKILRLYTGDRPLFNKFNLEEQIESIYKRRVQLPAGGEIVIDGTEALTAVDVNSARSRHKGDAEENALRTNLEAAAEIARQLRLRDLGGLVVIDFNDMMAPKNRKKVEDAMRTAMRGDRARHDLTRLSKMGLMEIARQRLKSPRWPSMYTSCPTCEGYGLIKNLEAAAIAALRKLQTRSTRTDIGRIRLALRPTSPPGSSTTSGTTWCRSNGGNQLHIDIEPRARLLRHETELEAFPREQPVETPSVERVDPPAPKPPAAPEPVEVPPPDQTGAPADSPEADRTEAPAAEEPGVDSRDEKKTEAPERRKRRRRRRKPARPPKRTPPPRPRRTATDRHRPPATRAEKSAPSETAPAETTPRRRRRKRRRPRSKEASANGAAPADGKAGSEPAADEAPVPRSVRADELMPAAVGNTRGRAKRPSRSVVGSAPAQDRQVRPAGSRPEVKP